MKMILKSVAVALLAAAIAPAAKAASPTPPALLDSLSLNYGRLFASGILKSMEQMKAKDEIALNHDIVYNAFCEVFKSGKPCDLNALQNEIISQANRASDEAKFNSAEAVACRAAADAEVAKLKKNKKVKFTESGVAYLVEKKGKGEVFTADQSIDVNYVGKHLDGTVFDKSEKPMAMKPAQMVPGFKEALLMMKPGAKYTVYIPWQLAYGINGAPRGGIKRCEMLVFDIETVGLTAVEEPKK